VATNPYITPALFSFLKDLKKNNNRDWFQENKNRYEQHVREPLIGFVEDFSEHLSKISSHFLADPRKVGGSLFRIYRDVRFSKDKSPYKTHAGVHFRHERAKDVHAPGFYLHLDPGEVFIAAGIWHPDTPTLKLIRTAIVEDPKGWKRATKSGTFKKHFTLSGESLKRAPAGFDANDPLIEDLKRKDFIGVTDRSVKDATAPDFMTEFAKSCKGAISFTKFLTGAIGLPF